MARSYAHFKSLYEKWHLTSAQHQPCDTLSYGQKKKAAFMSLSHDIPLWLLDVTMASMHKQSSCLKPFASITRAWFASAPIGGLLHPHLSTSSISSHGGGFMTPHMRTFWHNRSTLYAAYGWLMIVLFFLNPMALSFPPIQQCKLMWLLWLLCVCYSTPMLWQHERRATLQHGSIVAAPTL